MKAWKAALAAEPHKTPYYRPKTSLYQAMRQCYRKAGFSTTEKAHARVEEIKAESGNQLFVYNCTQCGKYHLTKNPGAEGKTF